MPGPRKSGIDLRSVARQAMRERGFLTEFPPEVGQEISRAAEPDFARLELKDLSQWLWSSIDNDDTRDLDQLEYAVEEAAGIRIYIAIADVTWFVPPGSNTDRAARHNTTSVYTGVETFHMLPERLSTDLTSLVENGKRLALVVEMQISPEGRVTQPSVYPAIVCNHAQLTYGVVAAWLDRESGRAGERESGGAGERESGGAGERESGGAGERESGRAGERESGGAGERESRGARERESGGAGERESGGAGEREKVTVGELVSGRPGEGRSDVRLSDVGRGSDVRREFQDKIESNPTLQQQLVIQDRAASRLRRRRHEAGALNLQTREFRPAVLPDGTVDLRSREPNRAGRLIEDFMIAANQATAGFLESQGLPGIRRVVRDPARWDRIVELAREHGGRLPDLPDAPALEEFLREQQQRNPEDFPDLSLAIIKLLGRGEYLVIKPGEESPGHFGLAVADYTHSTAPNRRYPDLLTQQLIKKAFARKPPDYSIDQLQDLAAHCTHKEDDANKVERFVRKCIAALALQPRIGKRFNGMITGASPKGTWVRIHHPPVEGKLHGDIEALQVGDRVRVKLISTNPRQGFIDFELER